jgi:Co/Zn/Cd efflux system component
MVRHFEDCLSLSMSMNVQSEHGHDHGAGPAGDLVSRVQNTEEEVREWNQIDHNGNRRFSIDSRGDTAGSPGDSTPASSSAHDHDTDEQTPLIGGQRPLKGKNAGGHAHSHSKSGSMNMRSLVLHVLGDALGNVGVIATGLIICTYIMYPYLRPTYTQTYHRAHQLEIQVLFRPHNLSRNYSHHLLNCSTSW